MRIEWGSPYDPKEAIQKNIDNGKQPTFDEGSTSWACVEDAEIPYTWSWDFEPILEPTIDGFNVPEDEDPDNICPTQEEINNMYK